MWGFYHQPFRACNYCFQSWNNHPSPYDGEHNDCLTNYGSYRCKYDYGIHHGGGNFCQRDNSGSYYHCANNFNRQAGSNQTYPGYGLGA